jgi:hypothetical protein
MASVDKAPTLCKAVAAWDHVLVADKANYYRHVTARLVALMDMLANDLPPSDRQFMTEYLDHNELGLALGQLVYVHVNVSLAGPEPSGSANPSRHCRSCLPPSRAFPRSGCSPIHASCYAGG